MKKLFLMLAVLVWLALPGQAWAAEAQEDTYLTMEQQLEIVRKVKAISPWGHLQVPAYNPAKLEVSCPLPIYIYTEEGFEQHGQYLPLLFEGQPVFFVLDDGNGYYLDSRIYNWLLQAGAALDKPFALVWDKTSLYYYDGAKWLLLYQFRSFQDPNCAVLDVTKPVDTSNLALTELRPVQSLEDAYFERWPGEEEVVVYLAGEKRAAGVLTKGRAFLPLRAICDMLNVQVDYDAATQRIYLHNRQDVYTFRLNEEQVNFNGRRFMVFDAPSFERDGVTYLPMRYLAELLQLEVQWDEAARRVDLQPDGQVIVSVVRHVYATMENWDIKLESPYWAKWFYNCLDSDLEYEVAAPEHIGRWPNLDVPDFYYLLTGYDFWRADGSLAFSCEVYLHVPGQPLPEGYAEYLLHHDDKWYNMPGFSDIWAEWDKIEGWQRVD